MERDDDLNSIPSVAWITILSLITVISSGITILIVLKAAE